MESDHLERPEHTKAKQKALSLIDTKGIIDVCKGLSLNDSYWIVPENFDGRFADFNLYENRFSQTLSLVAYTGAGTGHDTGAWHQCHALWTISVTAIMETSGTGEREQG